MMLNVRKAFQRLHKDSSGLTASETVTIVAVLGAVAYLVMPLIFPSDDLGVREKAETDLNKIAGIISERARIADINGELDQIQFGNLGVYASYSEVAFQTEVDLGAGIVDYCLISNVDNNVFYLDSFSNQVSETPVGFCLPSETDEEFLENAEDATSSEETSEPSEDTDSEPAG